MCESNIEYVLDTSIDNLRKIFERTDFEIEWKKIQKKMEEARFDPGAVRPLVDVIFSLFVAARSRGYNAHSVLAELEKVAAESLTKKWKQMPDGTYQSF